MVIIRDFGALHKEGRCIKCFKSFSEREVVFHLAIEHHKVNDALRKDGFNMLLSQIKAEPYDLKERVNNMITAPEAPLEENKEDGGGKEADMDENEDKSQREVGIEKYDDESEEFLEIKDRIRYKIRQRKCIEPQLNTTNQEDIEDLPAVDVFLNPARKKELSHIVNTNIERTKD